MPSRKPWKIARDTFGCLRVWDADGTMIGGIHEDEWNDQEIIEHANLFASAPDLLAALEGMVKLLDTYRGNWTESPPRHAATAAIAKARGQC